MFKRSSKKEHPPTRPELVQAWEQLAAGDVLEAQRTLRSFVAQSAPVGDDRPEAELAGEILRADPVPEPGDGETPADPDTIVAAFAEAVRDRWLLGPREPARSPGPVSSSRFL